MTLFLLTNQAEVDLRTIARHTERHWGKRQRNQYLKQMDGIFKLLANRPALGAACDDVAPGYRKFPQGRHVIFYRPDGERSAILIVRILHASMDISAHIG